MALRIIKEIIIMLLICLVGMLLYALVFYEYIPNRKIIAEVKTYTASDEVQQILEDDVDKRNEKVVVTYEVTSSDLNNYEKTDEYIPGKSNPFAVSRGDIEPTPPSDTENNSDGDIEENNDNGEQVTTPKNETTTNSYFKDNGLK